MRIKGAGLVLAIGAVTALSVVGGLAPPTSTATALAAADVSTGALADSRAVAADLARDPSAVDRYATELWRLHEAGLVVGGKATAGDGAGQPVRVLVADARKRGFSAGAIRLAEESAALSNRLTARLSASRPGVADDPGAFASFPALSAFFTVAPAPRATTPAATNGILGRTICGWYVNPKPSHAARWKSYTRANPAATLRSLGYHPSPNAIGGGWTRPQTWRPFFCGRSTYRDHALIRGRHTLLEQNYKGSPPGEPNPEVWRSGPWPYSDWPAYVFWWHRTH